MATLRLGAALAGTSELEEKATGEVEEQLSFPSLHLGQFEPQETLVAEPREQRRTHPKQWTPEPLPQRIVKAAEAVGGSRLKQYQGVQQSKIHRQVDSWRFATNSPFSNVAITSP